MVAVGNIGIPFGHSFFDYLHLFSGCVARRAPFIYQASSELFVFRYNPEWPLNRHEFNFFFFAYAIVIVHAFAFFPFVGNQYIGLGIKRERRMKNEEQKSLTRKITSFSALNLN